MSKENRNNKKNNNIHTHTSCFIVSVLDLKKKNQNQMKREQKYSTKTVSLFQNMRYNKMPLSSMTMGCMLLVMIQKKQLSMHHRTMSIQVDPMIYSPMIWIRFQS